MDAPPPSKVETAYRLFEARIGSGAWPVGFCMPTETQLAVELGFGRSTISQAITKLVHEGLVERRKRAGTRVIRNPSIPEPVAPRAKPDAFAFIFPSARHESTRRMRNGFQQAANDRERRVVILETGADYEKGAEYIARLAEFDVCGAVISPLLSIPDDFSRFSDVLLRCPIPVVLVGTMLHDFPAVFFDSFHAGYTATKHLLDAGARRIGFLSTHTAPTRNQYNGYVWALEEIGIEARPEWSLRENDMTPNYENPLDEPNRVGARFLRECPEADAVVCSHDYLALGVIAAAAAAGRNVPGDLKVVGIDDLDVSAQTALPPTCYHIPFEEAGQKALEMLQGLVDGTPTPSEIKLRGTLVRRASS